MITRALSSLLKPAGWLTRRLIRGVAPTFTAGVTGIIINDKGELYVQKHRFWPRQAWGLPGGFLKRGESPEQGITREIAEETGLEVTETQLVEVSQDARGHINILFVCEVADLATIKLQRLEVIEARFCPPDSLPEPFSGPHQRLLQRTRALLPTQ